MTSERETQRMNGYELLTKERVRGDEGAETLASDTTKGMAG